MSQSEPKTKFGVINLSFLMQIWNMKIFIVYHQNPSMGHYFYICNVPKLFLNGPTPSFLCIDVVLGIQTQGRRMVDADVTT